MPTFVLKSLTQWPCMNIGLNLESKAASLNFSSAFGTAPPSSSVALRRHWTVTRLVHYADGHSSRATGLVA